MDLVDFSNGFDVLLNSFSPSGTRIELNEHEKSVFLTKAQEEEVLSIYTGKNLYGDTFEGTEELRRFLEPIVETETLDPIGEYSSVGVTTTSKFFSLPSELWFIIYESVYVKGHNCGDNTEVSVYPVRHDEYQKIAKNPFRGANERRVLRLDIGKSTVEEETTGTVELISINTYTITKYYIRYLKKLSPIILAPLDKEAAINGETSPTECELHEGLHQRILNRAVAMALQSRNPASQQEYRQ